MCLCSGDPRDKDGLWVYRIRRLGCSAGVQRFRVYGVEVQAFRDSRITIWVVVKNRVPFWVPNIVRHLIFRVPKKGP